MTISDKRDEALKIAKEILAAEAHLAALNERFRRIVGGGPVQKSDATVALPLQLTPPGASASAASRVLAVFTRQPGKKVAVQDVVAELSDLDPALVRSSINRMGRTGKLKSVRRGVYRFVPAANGEVDTEV